MGRCDVELFFVTLMPNGPNGVACLFALCAAILLLLAHIHDDFLGCVVAFGGYHGELVQECFEVFANPHDLH